MHTMDHYREESPTIDEGWWQATLQATTSYGQPESLDYHESRTDHPSALGSPSKTWREIEASYQADEIVTLPVISYNGGGLLVYWDSVRCFVPASHLIDFNPQFSIAERRRLLAKRMGTTVQLKIIEYIPNEQRVVLSERAAQTRPGTRDLLMKQLMPGATVEGKVTNITEFGVFLDLGGIEGLVHVSEMSWSRVPHPADLVKMESVVSAVVMQVYPQDNRVALSMKRLQPDPWQTVVNHYQVGQVVSGTVSYIVNFGAFVLLEEGLEGLIHISELAEGDFMHPANVVRKGQRVQAQIIAIQPESRRLRLSLRRMTTKELHLASA